MVGILDLPVEGRASRQPHKPLVSLRLLRGFDQLHFAVAGAVQDHDFAFGIAEDEDVAVAEVGFFDGFFERHGAHGDGLVGAQRWTSVVFATAGYLCTMTGTAVFSDVPTTV